MWHDNDVDDYGEVDDDDTAATAIKKSFLLCNFFFGTEKIFCRVFLYRREVEEYRFVIAVKRLQHYTHTADDDALYKYEILLCVIYF